MDFSTQIKKLRNEKNLSQQQMSEQLGISRKAVSSWENDRSLPDIEMLIIISRTFGITLDELILGGNDMNNMTQKLINDGKATRRARMNLISVCIGTGLLLIGAVCLMIRSMMPAVIDEEGLLQEPFFLVPFAFLLFAAGFMVFAVTGFSNFAALVTGNAGDTAGSGKKYIGICISVLMFGFGGFLVLLASNSGAGTALPGCAVMIAAVLVFAAVMIWSRASRRMHDAE